MTTERIDIEINDKISSSIRTKILQIGTSAKAAYNWIDKLNSKLEAINTTALSKLAAASSKVTTALTKETTASAKLTAANEKMQIATDKVALSQQKLATETARTKLRQEQANAASSKAELSALKLKNAQDKLTTSTNKSSNAFGSFIKKLALFVGVSFGAKEAVEAADAYTLLQNKLKNVVDTEAELEDITGKVFAVANKSRTGVDAIAQSYQRFYRALEPLGAGQQEVLDLTETISKALVISGATTEEQTSSLLQLSQAFNKGKLDGDEFRTVMETMPDVADAIAKQLNVTRGALLELAPQGKITAEVMRDAFASAREEINDKFAKALPTVSQAFTVLKNNVTKFIGEVDKATGFTAALSSGIIALSKNLNIAVIAVTALGTAIAVSFSKEVIANILSATKAVKGFTLALAKNPIGLIAIGLTTAAVALYQFRNEIKLSEDGVLTFGNVFLASMQLIGEAIAPVAQFFKDVWNSAFGDVDTEFSSLVKVLGDGLSFVTEVVKFQINTQIALWTGAYNTITGIWEAFPKSMENIAKLTSNLFVATIETMVNLSLKPLKSILQLANDASNAIGQGDLFTIPKVDLSVAKFDLETGIGELGQIANDSFKEAFATDFVGDAVTSVTQRAREIAEKTNTGFTAPDLGDGIASSSSSKKTDAPDKKTNNAELLKEIEKIRSETVGAQEAIATAVQATNLVYATGNITLDEYKSRMVDLNLQATELKLTMGDGTFADAMLVGIGRVQEGFTNVLTSLGESFGNFFTSLSDGFADSIGKAIVYGDDLKTSLLDVARQGLSSLISSLVKMGIQMAVNASLGTALGAAATAATSAQAATVAAAWAPAASAASLASYGANAAPAAAGMTSTYALGSALAATGFESGGYTGDGGTSDVAGVVHGKEFVMNAGSTSRIGKADLEALQNGTASVTKNTNSSESSGTESSSTSSSESQGGSNVRIINVVDSAMVGDYMSSSEGEEVFVNTMRRNSDQLKQIVNND